MLQDNLFSLRKMKKMSQEELADRIGVSRQTLSKWETGESIPDLEKGRKLADLFGVSLDELMNYEPPGPGLPVPPKGKHFFGVATVGDKGQVVIPARARKIFHITPGDQLVILGDEESGLALIPPGDLLVLADRIRTEMRSDG